jgi:ABC-type transport system involved in multi-copper enzyme maturation permease subunit
MTAYVVFMTATFVLAMHFSLNELGLTADGTFMTPIDVAQLPYPLVTLLTYVFPAMICAMAITQEYRHKSLTLTYLVEPRRGVVLVAKAIAAIPMGAAFGLAAVLSGGLTVAGVLALVGGPTGLDLASTWAMAGRAVLALALWGVIGVGFGALITNQVVVIVGLLVLSQLVEPLLRTITAVWGHGRTIVQFLPSAAADSVTGSSVMSLMTGGVGAEMSLSGWAGTLVMVAWAALFAGIGYLVSLKRDIT